MSISSETALTHSMGQRGFKYLSTAGTDSTTEIVIAIQALTDSTITVESVRGDDLTNVSITAGAVIVGEFDSVTVSGAGGEVLAYLAK